jgi:hypothetical protein
MRFRVWINPGRAKSTSLSGAKREQRRRHVVIFVKNDAIKRHTINQAHPFPSSRRSVEGSTPREAGDLRPAFPPATIMRRA